MRPLRGLGAPPSAPARFELPARVLALAQCAPEDYKAAMREVTDLLALFTRLGAPQVWQARVLGLAAKFKQNHDALSQSGINVGAICVENIGLGRTARAFAEELAKGARLSLPPARLAPSAGTVKGRVETYVRAAVDEAKEEVAEEASQKALLVVAGVLIAGGVVAGGITLALARRKR